MLSGWPNGRGNPQQQGFVTRFGPTPQTNTANPFYRSLHILLRPIPPLFPQTFSSFRRYIAPNEIIICVSNVMYISYLIVINFGFKTSIVNFSITTIFYLIFFRIRQHILNQLTTLFIPELYFVKSLCWAKRHRFNYLPLSCHCCISNVQQLQLYKPTFFTCI